MKRIAVYPGTFDPMTNGHLDIIRRAAAVFDEVIVTVSINRSKKTLFDQDERYRLAREACSGFENVSVSSFSGLLIDFVREQGAQIIIRGLRAVTDFEYEYSMALMNLHLSPDVETLFMSASEGNSFVSSSMVKEVFMLGGDVSDKIPPCVLKALQKAYSNED